MAVSLKLEKGQCRFYERCISSMNHFFRKLLKDKYPFLSLRISMNFVERNCKIDRHFLNQTQNSTALNQKCPLTASLIFPTRHLHSFKLISSTIPPCSLCSVLPQMLCGFCPVPTNHSDLDCPSLSSGPIHSLHVFEAYLLHKASANLSTRGSLPVR